MPNNCLSVLYKRIIQVENKNVGLKVGGTNMPLPPPQYKSVGGDMFLLAPHPPTHPPPPLPTPVHWFVVSYMPNMIFSHFH